MALKLIASYSKRLGLPGYSSHQFSVSIETELTGHEQVMGETAKLYASLQRSVDEQIQHTGFVPGDGYGLNGSPAPNGNGGLKSPAAGQCTNKQQDLITKLIEENHLDQAEIESLIRDRFHGKDVKQLTKVEASALIDELLERVGDKPAHPSRNEASRPLVHGGVR